MNDRTTFRKIIRRADVILIMLILFASLILSFVQASSYSGSYSKNATVEIILDGEAYGIYPLGTPREIAVHDEYKNVVAIEKNKDGTMFVRMKSAVCPGLDCVHHAPIELGGQSIVCLPSKLIVKIQNGGDEPDGFTY
jgi:hypothetical protein